MKKILLIFMLFVSCVLNAETTVTFVDSFRIENPISYWIRNSVMSHDGDWVFGTTQATAGKFILDIRDLNNIHYEAHNYENGYTKATGTIWDSSDDTIFAAIYNNNAFISFDVSDKTQIVTIDSITSAANMDNPYPVVQRSAGDYAFVGCYDDDMISVVDIHDATNLSVDHTFTHAQIVGPIGFLLKSNDDVLFVFCGNSNRIVSLDVSDVSDISYISSIESDTRLDNISGGVFIEDEEYIITPSTDDEIITVVDVGDSSAMLIRDYYSPPSAMVDGPREMSRSSDENYAICRNKNVGYRELVTIFDISDKDNISVLDTLGGANMWNEVQSLNFLDNYKFIIGNYDSHFNVSVYDIEEAASPEEAFQRYVNVVDTTVKSLTGVLRDSVRSIIGIEKRK